MKPSSPAFLAIAVWALIIQPSLCWSQGALTPPGPPGAAMKSLAQVEPGTAISILPFTITNSGSYYLAGSLSGTSGQSGINVQADNVTLDMNGFTLTGAAGAFHGIGVAAGKQGLVVVN